MSTFERLQNELHQTRLEARVAQEWLKFLKRPQAAHVRPIEANFRLFQEAFTDLNQFDADACILLLDAPQFVASLSLVTPQQSHTELEALSRTELQRGLKQVANTRRVDYTKAPELPARYTKEILLQLANTAPGRAEFRKLASYYGFPALTARINGEV